MPKRSVARSYLMQNSANSTLVLKVGTSTIVDNQTNTLDSISFKRIGKQIDKLINSGHKVILVSSGARNRLPHIGWDNVVAEWGDAINSNVKSYLLTEKELDSHNGCEGIIDTTCSGAVAIVNANDQVLHHNSRYRNNDIVAATLIRRLSEYSHSETQLGMLSDVHGVHSDVNDPGSVISLIHDIGHYQHLAGGAGGEGATGGMATKFEAAKIAQECGVRTWIAHGRVENAILEAMNGRIGTHFVMQGA